MDIRKLKANEIETRVNILKEDGCSLLLYKDARADMKILDEVFGKTGWQRTHKTVNNNLFCQVSVWDSEKEQWIIKEDVGVESYSEAEKGQASDAFKRACFNIGIGRELYTAPFIWINLNPDETYKTNKGKLRLQAKVNFNVDKIEYKDDRISGLVIKDQDGNKRYEMGKYVGKPDKKKKKSKSDYLDDIRKIYTKGNVDNIDQIIVDHLDRAGLPADNIKNIKKLDESQLESLYKEVA